METKIDTNKIGVYTASAGSGKTYMLTSQYIRLAVTAQQKDSQWNVRQAGNILAITFTNAAAADMKRKIVDTLAQISAGSYSDMEELAISCGLDLEVLQKRCYEVLRYVLHKYGKFSVQTIDSFVQRIIRPFAFELGLPRNYEADIDIKKWENNITKALLDDYGREGMEEHSHLIDGFIKEMAESEGKGKMDIEKGIKKILNLAFQEKSISYLQSLSMCEPKDFILLLESFGRMRTKLEIKFWEEYSKLREYIYGNGLISSDFHGGSTGFWAFIDAEIENGRDAILDFNQRESKIAWNKSIDNNFLKSDKHSEQAAQIKEGYERLKAINTESYKLSIYIEKHLYALSLINKANYYKKKMQEVENKVPISEFNDKIHKLLKDADIPYLYERVGAIYKHILVDEFQDTSALQWSNLLPLIDNNRASSYWNMIVGDPKQSIYRFRSANMEQMINLRENKAIAQKYHLPSNWRSDPGIVAFNNLFYSFIKEEWRSGKENEKTYLWERIRVRLKRIYDNHEQYYKKDLSKYPDEDFTKVRISIYDAEREKGEDKETYQNWNIRKIKEILDKHLLSEVTILCSKNEEVSKLANELVASGYPVRTNDSLLVESSVEVRLLLSAIRYMSAPYYSVYKKKLCWFISRIWGYKTDSREMDNFINLLDNISKDGRTLYDKVQHILRAWDIRRFSDQYILTFLDFIQKNALNNEDDFIQEWDIKGKGSDCIIQAQGDNTQAVRIMTVHKSKGLEFDVVIYAFASGSPKEDSLLWTHLPDFVTNDLEKTGEGQAAVKVALISQKDAFSAKTASMINGLAEEEVIKSVIDKINTLYVATTRASDKLYVLSKSDYRSGVYSENLFWQRFVEKYPAYKEEERSLSEVVDTTLKDTQIGENNNCEDIEKDSMIFSQSVCQNWRASFKPVFFYKKKLKEKDTIWGSFIHKILSKIYILRSDSLREIKEEIEKLWNIAPIEKHSKEEVYNSVVYVVNNPMLKECFSEGGTVYNERDLCYKGEMYRPDRVVFKEDVTYLVDYKTGEYNESHQEQIYRYKEILEQMNYKNIISYVVYIQDGKVDVKQY